MEILVGQWQKIRCFNKSMNIGTKGQGDHSHCGSSVDLRRKLSYLVVSAIHTVDPAISAWHVTNEAPSMAQKLYDPFTTPITSVSFRQAPIYMLCVL